MCPVWSFGFSRTSIGLPASFHVQTAKRYVRQILSGTPGAFNNPVILCTMLYFASRFAHFHTEKMHLIINRFRRAIYRARVRFGLSLNFITFRCAVAFQIRIIRRTPETERLKIIRYVGGAVIACIGFCYCLNVYRWFINKEWNRFTIRICYIFSVLLETVFHSEETRQQPVRRYRKVIKIYTLLTNPSLFLLLFPYTWDSMAPLFSIISYLSLLSFYKSFLESQNQELEQQNVQ